ncbi:hypothetical protein SCP_1004290 [Sparassis crispa]|uniref:Uncharacterized protein n=1 Tax=Sparassis crispa TaxID=139825 RepID=A0A401GYA8_9APHY|nr:hypothetical protein SCP_1004290 [Sparassis crispa]GBE87182.1 hypothetical protein SCP_1004290 [Sparassis crispa]
MIATTPPSAASAFTAAARYRLVHVNATALPSPASLFARRNPDGMAVPTVELQTTLARVRALYGCGMGFASLRVLAGVVRATVGLRWKEGSEIEDLLASVDSDICQGIQSSREEMEGGRVSDLETARDAVNELRSAVKESLQDVEIWGGDYPFERGEVSLDFWKM